MVQSVKNALAAVTDLGLGDQLVQQLQDQEDTRKKAQQATGPVAPAGIGGMDINQGSLLAARSLGLY